MAPNLDNLRYACRRAGQASGAYSKRLAKWQASYKHTAIRRPASHSDFANGGSGLCVYAVERRSERLQTLAGFVERASGYCCRPWLAQARSSAKRFVKLLE
jgi:hypothetical protein